MPSRRVNATMLKKSATKVARQQRAALSKEPLRSKLSALGENACGHDCELADMESRLAARGQSLVVVVVADAQPCQR